MTRCSFCMKNFVFREGNVTFPNLAVVAYCLDCMSCSICGAKGQPAKGGLLGMTPLCQEHFEKYNRVLHLIAPADYPEEIIDAKLKYLNRVKERDTNLLELLDRNRPDKIEHDTAETIALAGNGGFKGLAFIDTVALKTKDKDRVAEVYERIVADLQDCNRQIGEFEVLKQNKNNSSNGGTDLVVSNNKDHEMEVIEQARRKIEALDPNNNKSIDAKAFLNGQITYLPEPYLIV